MTYADSFVIPVPKRNVARYKKVAQTMAKLWRDHGALEYREWLADDAPVGKVTSFPQSVKRKPSETLVVGLVVYKSRADRDRTHKHAMRDPRFAALMDPKSMPFDGKRMIFGGFKLLVEGKAPKAKPKKKAKTKARRK